MSSIERIRDIKPITRQEFTHATFLFKQISD